MRLHLFGPFTKIGYFSPVNNRSTSFEGRGGGGVGRVRVNPIMSQHKNEWHVMHVRLVAAHI